MPKKLRIPLAIAAALLGIYAAVGFLLAPRWVDQAFREFVSTRLGKAPVLAELHINPFALSLEARGLAIREADGTTLVGCERLYVNASLASLFRRAIVIQELALERPTLAAILRADHTLNLNGLVPAADPHAPPAPPDAPLPAVRIALLKITAGEASFEDRTRATPRRAVFTPIALTLRDFSTQPGTGNAFTLLATGPSGTHLSWDGSAELQPFAAQGRFVIEQLAATTIGEFAGELLPFGMPAGELGLVAHYQLSSPPQGLQAVVQLDSIDATGLELRARGSAQSEVKLGKLALRAARFDLAQRSADLGSIELGGVEVQAVLDQAGLNLARLGGSAEPAPAPTAAVPVPAPAAWLVKLPRLALGDSTLHFEDRTRDAPVRLDLSAVSFTATGYSSVPGTEIAVTAEATVGSGGDFMASLNARPDTRAAHGHLSLSGFDLLPLQPYLAGRVRLGLRSGKLDLIGDFRAAVPAGNAAPTLAFDGETTVRSFATTDRQQQKDFIKWQKLRVTGIRYRSQPASLKISQVIADEPYVDLSIAANGTTNISDVLARGAATALAPAAPAPAPAAAPASAPAPAPAPAPADPGPPTDAMAVDIGLVTIRNGSANFDDQSVLPVFGTGIQTLSGTIKGLSSRPDSRAVVALEGAVDKYAPVRIEGTVNYFAAQSYTDLKASFRNMELTALNPYAGKFAGYEITRGKLSVDLSYRIENRKLEASHKILLTQLQLGERVASKEAVSLPLRLVVALLKDRDGNIDLDLPVTGNLDDPHFRVGPIIWKMFVNLCTKIVTAPFALLGKLFGGGEEMNFVDFGPGLALLEPAMGERLATLRKALVSRPGLEIEIPLGSNRELDGEALREVHWQQELAQVAPPEQRADRKRYLQALAKRYVAVTGAQPDALLASASAPAAPAAGAGPAPKVDKEQLQATAIATLETALRARVAVSDAELEALAQARARAVQDALLQSGEVDPLRVFIVAPTVAAPAAGHVRVELALRR
jgi:hypothetical protein